VRALAHRVVTLFALLLSTAGWTMSDGDLLIAGAVDGELTLDGAAYPEPPEGQLNLFFACVPSPN